MIYGDGSSMVEPRIVIPLVVGSSPILHPTNASVAQVVEQRTENPCVTSSTLVVGTNQYFLDKSLMRFIKIDRM